MKTSIQTCFCFAILLVALCLPVEARITVGISQAKPLAGNDQATQHLSQELGRVSGTEVVARHFENDATIINWLLRFQEIDAAILAPGVITQQPAGTLLHLADLHTKGGTPSALVVRSNLSSSLALQIKDAFLKLGGSDSGRKALREIGFAGSTLPGEMLQLKVARPEQLPKAEKKPVQKVEIRQTPAPQQQETVQVSTNKVKAPLTESLSTGTQQAAPATPAAQVASSVTPPTTQEASSVTPPTTQETSSVTPPTAQESTSVIPPATQKATPAPVIRTPATPEPAIKASDEPIVTELTGQESKQTEDKDLRTKAPEPKVAPNKHVTIFIALVILLAILLKICLFTMRWQNKKKAGFKPVDTPDISTTFKSKTIDAPAAAPDVDAAETLIVETGQLGPGKVPALLKRCADLPKPVVLHVNKGFCEKMVFFAGGQVAGALTLNSTTQETGVLWNKLGSLLVREELITKEGQDQSMALIKQEPGLRFGEALLKLGLIKLTDLRHALTRQAKATVYSLILFPEGSYQIVAGDGSLPPEESVSLEIKGLIREASHHQSEWTAIRQALPNLNTALSFCPEGRSKVEKVNLSAQQEEILSLIDGKRTINELCIESTMMDYEVYRFLYMMVKAGVLK